MTDSYSFGLIGEQMACDYMASCGMTVLEKRFRAKDGEIDIIARDGDVLCFVEVKYRPRARLSEGLPSVNDDKRRRLRLAGHYYVHKTGWRQPFRFDIIEITRAGVRYLKGNCS